MFSYFCVSSFELKTDCWRGFHIHYIDKVSPSLHPQLNPLHGTPHPLWVASERWSGVLQSLLESSIAQCCFRGLNPDWRALAKMSTWHIFSTWRSVQVLLSSPWSLNLKSQSSSKPPALKASYSLYSANPSLLCLTSNSTLHNIVMYYGVWSLTISCESTCSKKRRCVCVCVL